MILLTTFTKMSTFTTIRQAPTWVERRVPPEELTESSAWSSFNWASRDLSQDMSCRILSTDNWTAYLFSDSNVSTLFFSLIFSVLYSLTLQTDRSIATNSHNFNIGLSTQHLVHNYWLFLQGKQVLLLPLPTFLSSNLTHAVKTNVILCQILT